MQKREEVGLFREKFAGSQADRIAKAEAEANKTADKLEETKISGHALSFLSNLLYGHLYACLLTF